MVKTYHDRAEESTKRLELRSTAHSFTRIISEGTNCSPFEASIITEKAQEVFRIGDYHEKESLQPGQIIWLAISEDEPPGKPLGECKFKRIRLTIVSIDEDIEVLKQYGHSAKRGQQILRITREALDQRALLTQEDLAILLDCDVKTIRTDIKRYQQKHDIIIPTRGNKKDIGPGLTHRERAVEFFIQGKDAVTNCSGYESFPESYRAVHPGLLPGGILPGSASQYFEDSSGGRGISRRCESLSWT